MDNPGAEQHPSGGESADRAAYEAVRLAHRALDRFPDVVRKHKFIAGGAAVSGSLIVLAGVAIARRMRRGESAEEALASVTEEEIQGMVPEPRVSTASTEEGERTDSAPVAASPDAPATPASPDAAGTPAAGTAINGASSNGHRRTAGPASGAHH